MGLCGERASSLAATVTLVRVLAVHPHRDQIDERPEEQLLRTEPGLPVGYALDASCFEAKKCAVLSMVIEKARARHGPNLRIEATSADRDLALPEDVKVHREHELTPLAKTKGGFPVLRLRTRRCRTACAECPGSQHRPVSKMVGRYSRAAEALAHRPSQEVVVML